MNVPTLLQLECILIQRVEFLELNVLHTKVITELSEYSWVRLDRAPPVIG